MCESKWLTRHYEEINYSNCEPMTPARSSTEKDLGQTCKKICEFGQP